MRQRTPRPSGRPDAPEDTGATPPGAAPASAAVPGLDRDELTRVWGDAIFPAMHPGVRSVFRSGRWLAVDGATAMFAFEHPQFLQRGEERRPDVEAALGAYFGAPVRVRLVLDPATTNNAAPAGSRPASPRADVEPPPYEGPLPDQPTGEYEEDGMSAEEFARLPAAPDAPATAEALLLQAFPGSEEVAR